jgi:hypothetical protein
VTGALLLRLIRKKIVSFGLNELRYILERDGVFSTLTDAELTTVTWDRSAAFAEEESGEMRQSPMMQARRELFLVNLFNKCLQSRNRTMQFSVYGLKIRLRGGEPLKKSVDG